MTKRAAKKKTAKRGGYSDMIREFMSANPDAKPKAIFEALGSRGVKLGLINAVRAKMKKSAKVRSAGVKRHGKVGPSARNGNGHSSLESILRAAAFAKEVGGIESARSALSALETVKKSL